MASTKTGLTDSLTATPGTWDQSAVSASEERQTLHLARVKDYTVILIQNMMGAKSKRRIGGASIVLVFILVLGGFLPAETLAQGHSKEQFRETIGPYEIGVAAIPSNLSLGRVSFAVTVLDAATGQPVRDARVVLRIKHVSDATEGWGLAVRTTDIPGRYDAQMNMDTPGVWEVNVEVSSSLGRVSVETPPVVVPGSRNFSAGTLVFAGVFLVLILAWGYLWWSIRRQQRKRSGALTYEGPEEDEGHGS